MKLFYSKLTPLVELTENTDECVIFRVKPGMQSELVKLPGFYGDEQQFRITKPRNRVTAIGYRRPVEQSGKVADITIWPQKTTGQLMKDPTTLRDYYILGCVCVDYGIPIFSCGDEFQDKYLGTDIRNVWDKYRSKNQRLCIEFNEDSSATVRLNGYPIYREVFNKPDAYHGLTDRLPLLHRGNNSYARWRDDEIANKVCILTSPAYRDQRYRVVNSTVQTSLASIIDPELLEEYIRQCSEYASRSEIKVGGLFSIYVDKSIQDRQYTVQVAMPDKDLGCIEVATKIHVPFDDIRFVPQSYAIEPITISAKQEV